MGDETALALADRLARIGLSILYGLIAVWGVFASVYGISVLTSNFDFLAPLWLVISALSVAALLSLLLRSPVIEAVVIVHWVFFYTMYPTTMVLRFVFEDGAPARHAIVLAVAPLLFPITRLIYLIAKNRWKLPFIAGETREQRDQ